jgi:transposase
LYPNAELQTARISEFLKRLGTEETKQIFFYLYFTYLKSLPGISENVLIDSTSLNNNIDFEYAKISNHNGVIEKQTRLIYVVERNTGMPVYFRYVAGNVVDVSTLRTTINELKGQNMNIKHSILDAGYCSETNVKELQDSNISFIFRMPHNTLAKQLIAEHGKDLLSDQYSLKYGDRLLFMKEVQFTLYNIKCYLYITIDFDRMSSEQKAYALKKLANKEKRNPKKMANKEDFGYFILVSSEALERDNVMPLYYLRQTIEQIFDVLKNDTASLPLRTHTIKTFQGHLLISFIATLALITIKNKLKQRKKLASIPATQALQNMRSIKATVHGNQITTSEAQKEANLIIKNLKLSVPDKIIYRDTKKP